MSDVVTVQIMAFGTKNGHAIRNLSRLTDCQDFPRRLRGSPRSPTHHSHPGIGVRRRPAALRAALLSSLRSRLQRKCKRILVKSTRRAKLFRESLDRAVMYLLLVRRYSPSQAQLHALVTVVSLRERVHRLSALTRRRLNPDRRLVLNLVGKQNTWCR